MSFSTEITSNMFMPQEWYEHVQNTGVEAKAIQVIEMEQKNFKDYHQHLHRLYTERKKDKDENDLDFQHIVRFNLELEEMKLMEIWLQLSILETYGSTTLTM